MESSPLTIAIAGATGVVGAEILSVLSASDIQCAEVRLLASSDSVGEVYQFRDDELSVAVLNEEAFDGVDVALFATSADISGKFVPSALEAGALVIDNSSRYRMESEVPLVVPEVNISAVSSECKLIANPNCAAIQLVPVLKALEDTAGLEHVVVSTYQSVSGAGKVALDELWSQSIAVFNQQQMEHEAFQHQIAFNCIPQIDVMGEDGFTREEQKVMQECRKILGIPQLRITATCVRVPVFYGHAESVFVETRSPISVEGFLKALQKVPGLAVYPDSAEYPMQLDVAGTDEIHVGRIRVDPSVKNGVSFWVVADNVRKGAALNVVQILQALRVRAQPDA